MKKRYTLLAAMLALLVFPVTAQASSEHTTDLDTASYLSDMSLYENLFSISESDEIDNTLSISDTFQAELSEDKPIVSVLGDSIGTYRGYNPPWTIYYKYYCEDYMSVNDTWWMRYIIENDMQLGINDSLGGSKVSWVENDPTNYPKDRCMASIERITHLDDNGTPDTILFFGGTNDIGFSEIGTFAPGENIGDVSTFFSAYQTAIVRLQYYYPDAEIICMTPYYRDMRSYTGASELDDDRVDQYANAIIQICTYYDIKYFDLRNANIHRVNDMCTPDYLHPNASGFNKIWYMIQNGRALMDNEKITVKKNNGHIITAEYQVNGTVGDEEYCWEVYDSSTQSWIYNSGWSANNTFNYQPPHDGSYRLRCTIRNSIGATLSSTIATSFKTAKLTLNEIDLTLSETQINLNSSYVYQSGMPSFKWTCYNIDTKTWQLISNWQPRSSAVWMPQKGSYLVQVEAKDLNGTISSKIINYTVNRNYPIYINGKYQGPNPYGAGCLIGVSTNANPEQKYKYELLILDCEKLVNGDPHPWVFGTGLKKLSAGCTFWTTYTPSHTGYYWTYFRIYDENNQLIEDQCYGAFLY